MSSSQNLAASVMEFGPRQFDSKKNLLRYSVYKASSTSNTSVNFVAENILVDDPSDPSSRWSSDSNSPPQFLLLRLDKPAVISTITFGKYEKHHVCNLKRFKVFIGNEEDNLIEILDSGLKNDPLKETFRLRNFLNGQPFPCRFVKIMPIQSWGPSFNFSIWFIALHGTDALDVVAPALAWHQDFREKEAIRLCLKHLRRHNHLEIFESLQKKTRVQLEHPSVTLLFDTLVRAGNYLAAEDIVAEACQNGIFDQWIEAQVPKAKWSALITPNDAVVLDHPSIANVEAEAVETEAASPDPRPVPRYPSCRGGHQMVMDGKSQIIYLFGGWDGHRDLGDFWSYHILTNKWTLISANTEEDGGPSARSCHKMVFDSSGRYLFVLGRYIDRVAREHMGGLKSDFFMYEVDRNIWTLITDDTASMGGPSLIFDHQMCIDQQSRTIFVFGGQTLTTNAEESRVGGNEHRYAGMFEYTIPTNTWKKRVREASQGQLRSRSSHSMLFHDNLRKLFIFGGQRKRAAQRDEFLNDFFSYSVEDDELEIICMGNGSNESSIPAVGHTQRATIDGKRNEIHVMTGLNTDKEKDKDKTDKTNRIVNSFWVYNIGKDKWSCFYKTDNTDPDQWNSKAPTEPRPRYAHQLVYDDVNRVHYMFGGNPGGRQGKDENVRLGDFWKLTLERPSREEVLRQCRLLIRQGHFSEMAIVDKVAAVSYLQTRLSEIVDHRNSEEEATFRQLASQVFAPVEAVTSDMDKAIHGLRGDLFEKLTSFYPPDMTHPRSNLIDLVPIPSDRS